jgi:hypothetical protein
LALVVAANTERPVQGWPLVVAPGDDGLLIDAEPGGEASFVR